MSQSQTREWNKVRESQDYRSFLKAYLDEKSISLSDFARAAGCHRGFPGDVISRKRRLTAKSFYGFEKALRLPADGKKLFRLLVAREEDDVLNEVDRLKLPESIQSLKAKSWVRSRRNIKEIVKTSLEDLLQRPEVPLVFAATGDGQKGATYDQIQSRVHLKIDLLDRTLEQLVNSGLLKFENERYYSQDLHVFFQGVDSQEILGKLFRKAVLDSAERSAVSWNSKDEFFFFSNLCIRKNQLPELKEALRNTVLSFVDEAIQADGDQIVKLTASLHL